MRLADERFNASIMINSSMIESLTGAQQDWTTNTSAPRTFSSIRTRISPSLNDGHRCGSDPADPDTCR